MMMSDKPQTTETPWKTDDRTAKGEGFTIHSATAHYSRANVAHYVSRSDAALIVTAVNAFEPMKEALRLAHKELMWAYEQDEYAHGASGLRLAAQECWAVLRLAEGEKE
jgi:hypothetical protein